MRKKHYYFALLWLLFFISAAGLPQAIAQTPGLIYKTATAGGSRVLDPNQDGYISSTRTGFTGGKDEGSSSEIPYRQFPALLTEPLGDLNTGSTGGHTDLATPTFPLTSPSTGSPISAYFDGTNLLFRIRLGASSTASKGYSVLIDSDQTFNNTGNNPGFEFEVLLAANFAVQVIKHTATGSSTVFSGSVDQYSQKAVAASTSGGNTDYFYDFYVPLTAFQGGITATTPLRMSGITITSAQSGLTGTVSDVGGVNFQAYNYDAPSAWRALIGSFPPTSLNSIQTSGFAPIPAAAPVVSGPINANTTTISGTSVEALGSVVTVLRNGVAICGGSGQPTCPTVSSTGTWTLAGISSTLLKAGDVITATVTPSGKSVSPASSPVTVISGVCTATPAPVLTGQSSGNPKYAAGTTSYIGRQKITLYTASVDAATGVHSYQPQGSYIFTSTTTNTALPTTTAGMTSPTGVALTKAGNYVVTTTPVDANGNAIGCESLRSNQLCYQNGGNGPVNNYTATITNATGSNNLTYNTISELPASITALNGTLSSYTAGISVILFKNATQTTYRVTPTSTNWSINTTGLALAPGDILNVRVEASLSCGVSLSTPSNAATIKETTATPVINAITTCGSVKTVTGTSSEPGSLITIFTNGTSTNLTGTVSSTGVWSVDVSSLNNGSGIAAGVPITARAKTIGKATSLVSNTVTSSAAPTGTLTIASPINEGQTDISGTAPAGSQVTVYIEGTPFTAVAANANGAWTASGFSPLEIFAGAAVTANYKMAGSDCESEKVTPVMVQCSPPSSSPTVATTAVTVCSGSTAQVTVTNSEAGVAYRLITINGTTETDAGASVLGTGGAITLTSYPISSNTTLRVRARKVAGTNCTTNLTGSTTVTVNPLPTNTNTLSISSASGCAGTSPVVTVTGTQTGFSYQLINSTTKAPVVLASGNTNPQAGNGGSLTFAVGFVSATTTYGVLITNTTTGCAVEGANTTTYTVTGPVANQAVSVSQARICPGSSTNITVQTNNDGATYRLFDAATNRQVPGSATLNGNGQQQAFTVSPAATTTYYVQASNGSCTVNLVNRITVEVGASTAPVTAQATTAQPVCGSSATLQGSDPAPGTGRWTVKSKPQGSADPTFTDATSRNTTVNGLVSGSYMFTWTVTAGCGNTAGTTSAAEVSVTVNCPALYSIAPPRYLDEYWYGDVLASATDPDGGIVRAEVVAGSGMLPSGTKLLANGNIVVAEANEGMLAEGTYSFSVRTIDANGGETITPIILRIYGESPAINPLPVELVYFKAVAAKDRTELQWLTASEKDNDRFEVERSSDGKSFEKIGTVKGKGTTNEANKYSFADSAPLAGTTYYRLKQVDADGTFAYSSVLAINTNDNFSPDVAVLQAYPNPFTDKLNVSVTAEQAQQADLILVDLQGREVVRRSVELTEGANTLELSLPQLAKGMYVLKVVGGSVKATTKVMKNQ